MDNEWRRGDYEISTDKGRLDLDVINDFLNNSSYWATGRSLETIRRSIEHSLAFGLYRGERQIGFARVVTDYATFGWLADVFILEGFRGEGLGVWMMEVVINHPDLQGFRRWTLATKDAHALYHKFGFTELKRPERWMERRDPQTQETPDYWREGVD